MSKLFSVYFLSIIALPNSYSQMFPAPPAGIEYQINYTLEEVSFYEVPQGISATDLSPLDQIKLLPRRRLEAIERRVATNGSPSATILMLNPEEAYAEWPQKVGRYEIDGDGIRIYNTNGALYKTMPVDADETTRYLAIKYYFASHDPLIHTIFPMPSANHLIDLEAAGAIIVNLPDNALRISLGEQEMLFEPNLMQLTQTRYEGQIAVETKIQKYAYNLQGVVVPIFERTEKSIVRPSGACMQKVVQRKFSKYIVSARPRGRDQAADFSEKSTVVWPNPATGDLLNIRLDASVQRASEVTISNAVGHIVANLDATPGETLTLPLANWPDGMYFVDVRRNGAPMILKFVKHSY